MNAIVDPSKKAASVDEPPIKNKWLREMGVHPRELTREKKVAFLEAIYECDGIVSTAAERAGFKTTATLYMARKEDAEFREVWDYCVEAGKAKLVDSALRAAIERGRDGYDRTVWYQGEEAGVERVYDSNLLIAVLRAFDPRFKENRGTAADININANFGVAVLPVAMTSEADWEAQSQRLTDMQNKVAAAATANGGKVIDGKAEVVEIKRA